MAGYNFEVGMSNNAVDAYENGLLPASKIKGVPASLINEHCLYEEWHHASSHFNRVKFFDPEKVLATFGLLERNDLPASPVAVKALAEYKSAKQKENTIIHKDCSVEWIDWGGTRNRPVPTYMSAEKCTVEVKGNTATITRPSGSVFVKRLTTNGFSFISAIDRKAKAVAAKKAKREQAKQLKERNKRLKATCPLVPADVAKRNNGDKAGRAWAALVDSKGKKIVKAFIMMNDWQGDFEVFRATSRETLSAVGEVSGGFIFGIGKSFYFQPTER